MNHILNSPATIVCKNIPTDINRFEITEIFSKYGLLVGEGIYFGKKSSKVFYIKYQHFKDAVRAVENLKDGHSCPYDFNLSFSTFDEIKYRALKGSKSAIDKLKIIYNKKEAEYGNKNISKQIIAELNEQNMELIKIAKKEKAKKKDDSFILNLLAKSVEEEQCDEDIKLKEHLKNHINLNCLSSYNFDETNKYDNFLIAKFPN